IATDRQPIATDRQPLAQLLLDVGPVEAELATSRVAVERDLLEHNDDGVGLVVHERCHHVGDLACHGSLVVRGLAFPHLNGHDGHDDPPGQIGIGRAQRASASNSSLTVSWVTTDGFARAITVHPSGVCTEASTMGALSDLRPSWPSVVRDSTAPSDRNVSTQANAPHRQTSPGGKVTRAHAEQEAARTVMAAPPARR